MSGGMWLRMAVLGACAAALLSSGCRALTPYRPTPLPASATPNAALPPNPPQLKVAAGQAPPATAQIVPASYGPLPPCLTPADALATVSYPPGWSLVAGSAGSCLSGAAAAFVVLPLSAPQPQVLYEAAPLSAGLLGDQAYWVYFPAGGTLALSRAIYPPDPQVPFSAAELPCRWSQGTQDNWLALANGSPSQPLAVVSGARETLLYTPGQGYSAASTIPVGHAAWVWPAAGAVVAWPVRSGAAAAPPSCQ